MAVAHGAHDWDGDAAISATHVYNSGLTVTPGHTIGIIVWGGDAGAGAGNVTVTVTDNHSNTYTQIAQLDDATTASRAVSLYAKNVAGGTNYTVTVTWSGPVTRHLLTFHIMSGSDATAPLAGNDEQQQAAAGTGSQAVSSTAFTPSTAGAYLWGAMFGLVMNGTVTKGTGFTDGNNTGSAPFSGQQGLFSEYLIQGAAASQAVTFTQASANTNLITMAMAFMPSGGGGGGVTDGWKILLH